MAGLEARAALHGLSAAVGRALRLCHALYGTRVPEPCQRLNVFDHLYRRRMLARDGWGGAAQNVAQSLLHPFPPYPNAGADAGPAFVDQVAEGESRIRVGISSA